MRLCNRLTEANDIIEINKCMKTQTVSVCQVSSVWPHNPWCLTADDWKQTRVFQVIHSKRESIHKIIDMQAYIYFFSLKHQQCDYSLMPFMPQRNMIPLPAQSCEKHSRSGPFVLLQKCENVDLLCITNAFFNPIHGPAQWWILSQDLSLGFTTALLFLFQQ